MLWIIGDIHGCSLELMNLLETLPSEDQLIFLGDYIDRGPDSRGVLEILWTVRKRSIFLIGNHEDMMLSHFQEPESARGKAWLHPLNGGRETLQSYGMNSFCQYEDFPERHREIFASLKYYYEGDTFLAVHAGLNIKVDDLAMQSEEDLLWIREKWLHSESQWSGKHVYYGHTPRRSPGKGFIVNKGKKSTGIDTGCVYGGTLTAINPDTGEIKSINARKVYF